METNFNKTYNISYIDDNLPKPGLKEIFEHYKASLFVYGLVLLYLNFGIFAKELINTNVIQFLNYYYLAYIIIAPLIFIIFKPRSIQVSHNVILYRYFKKFINNLKDIKFSSFEEFKSSLKGVIPDYYEKQSMMLIFIKAFFGTLICTFFYNNISLIIQRMPYYKGFYMYSAEALKYGTNYFWEFIYRQSNFIYVNLITFLFMVDLFCYSIGYFTETALFKNKIRSCDISFAGIFFCIICYPPFNNVTNIFIGWVQNDNNAAFNDPYSAVTIVIRIIALVFLAIFTLASVALGTKASNLTNRGTVSIFPYNIVRHPAYICKFIFWILTTVSVFIIPFSEIIKAPGEYFIRMFIAAVITTVWGFIYFMRALTEERHLLRDPEYQAYTQKVKYRFIPGLF